MQVNSNQANVDFLVNNDFQITDEEVNSFQFENAYTTPVSYDNYKIKFPLKIDNHYDYDDIVSDISKYGTIAPSGQYLDTPDKINLELKPHQKRTLFEMYQREHMNKRLIKDNLLLLCDNVGSGKSLCVLSLIAKSPKVDMIPSNVYFIPSNVATYQRPNYAINGITFDSNIIELNSNLIVVPHGIYNQWKTYIDEQTELTSFSVATTKDILSVGSNKDDIITKLNSVNIVLVKSTMYMGFYIHLRNNDLEQEYDSINNENNLISDPNKIIDEVKKEFDNLREAYTEDHKYDEFDAFIEKMKKLRLGINYDTMNQTKNLATCFVNKKISGFVFQRVIIDEADSIKIPSCPDLYGKYTWFVTSSVNNLLYPKGKRVYENYKYNSISNGIVGSGFIKNTMRANVDDTSRYNRVRIFNCIVRSNYDFIQDSILIPDPVTHYLKCFTPPELLAVASAIHPDALAALNAGDMSTAVKLLGCEASTEDDLVKIVNKTLYKKRDELKASLADKELAIISNSEQQIQLNSLLENNNTTHVDYAKWKEELNKLKSLNASYKSSIKNFTEQLKNTETKIAGIEERIKGVKDKECPVCASQVENPCITPCCRNVFCLQCIHNAFKYSPKKECPLCRFSPLDLNKLHMIVDTSGNQVDEKDGNELPSKLEALTKFILDNPNKRILVFSCYENSFETIQNEFNKLSIRYSRISGSAARIKNIIAKYKNNEYQVLLLNATNFGAGLNLQITDDILIYHRMSKDLERQVIGRAQRLGRTEPLNIRYLCYENEYPTGTA